MEEPLQTGSDLSAEWSAYGAPSVLPGGLWPQVSTDTTCSCPVSVAFLFEKRPWEELEWIWCWTDLGAIQLWYPR